MEAGGGETTTTTTTVHAADSLARLIFLRTPDATASMQITLPSLETARELFFLLPDLFVRGLLLLFAGGGGGGRGEGIAVHDITAAQFDTLAARLRVAGIACRRTAVEDPSVDRASTNVDALARAPPDLPLERYRLVARTRGHVYTMWFSIVHNVAPGDMTCGGGVHQR